MPSEAPIEPPHEDLPEDCAYDYREARDVFSRSPRAAAALLRLCIQKLMPYIGGDGKGINDDIAKLVRQGLPVKIQQSLDICRVVGNNAVHPGSIDLTDSPETAQALFQIINLTVEELITRPREVEEFYETLPINQIEAINKRDKDSAQSNEKP